MTQIQFVHSKLNLVSDSGSKTKKPQTLLGLWLFHLEARPKRGLCLVNEQCNSEKAERSYTDNTLTQQSAPPICAGSIIDG